MCKSKTCIVIQNKNESNINDKLPDKMMDISIKTNILSVQQKYDRSIQKQKQIQAEYNTFNRMYITFVEFCM